MSEGLVHGEWYCSHVFELLRRALLVSSVRMRDHTSLRVWQEAHIISVEVIRLAKSFWKPYAAALFSQLQRSSLSVQLNIAEGYTYGDSPTFTRHLGIAYGSAVETGELLQLAIDAGVLGEEHLKPLLERNQETKQILLGMLKRRRRFQR
jgi:four helix bundle protein